MTTISAIRLLISNMSKSIINRWFLVAVALVYVYSCSDSSINGSYNQNKPPKTNLTINEVNRSGSDRLSSQISISWWGDDPDGFIIGYEYAFDADTLDGDWRFTRKTDSTFVLPIPLGKDTADVFFRVRAIDNDSLRDPIGAKVAFPIRNSPPTVQFIANEVPSDTSYSIFNFGWNIEDIDGFSNISKVELQLNQSGTWFTIDKNEPFIAVEIEDQAPNTVDGKVYFGQNFRNSGITISGFKMEADNDMMIRVFDAAGSESVIDTVKWFIKRQSSRILVLHDNASASANATLQLHLNSLEAAGITNYDLIYINDGVLTAGLKITRTIALPRITEPTLIRFINKWDFIYLFSSDLDRNITHLQEMTTAFLADGGKIFTNVPMKTISTTDPLFSFLPLQAFASLPDSVDSNNDGKFDQAANATNFRLLINRTGNPTDVTWPTLRVKRTLNLAPMVPSSGAVELYLADFDYQYLSFPRPGNRDFTGSESICLKSAENNIIYFSLDFNDVEIVGSSHLGDLIKKLCVDELGFTSN